MRRRWEFYRTASGGAPVRKEIKKLSLTVAEQAKVQAIMDRVAEGRTRPQDVRQLRDGVREVRVRVANRRLRLLFADAGDGEVLLALHLFAKQQQIEARHIEVAVDRLREWRTREG